MITRKKKFIWKSLLQEKQLSNFLIMYRLFLVLILLFLLKTNCIGQSKNYSTKKFSFQISSGVTIHTDGNIYNRNGLIANLGLDYLEFAFFYKLSKVSEIGISIGKNNFTKKAKIIYDTNLFSIQNLLLNNQWVAINFKISWIDKWYLGVKIGTVDSENGNAEALLGIYLEKEVFRLQNLFSKFKIEYDNKASINNLQINSNQINLLFCIGFNL